MWVPKTMSSGVNTHKFYSNHKGPWEEEKMVPACAH